MTAPITLPRSLMPPSPPRSGQPRTTLRSGRRSSRQLSLPLNSEHLNCSSSLIASSLLSNSTAGGVYAMPSSRRSVMKRALALRDLPHGAHRMFRARRIIRPMHLRTKDLIAHSEVVPPGWYVDPMTLRARVGRRCREIVRVTTVDHAVLPPRSHFLELGPLAVCHASAVAAKCASQRMCAISDFAVRC